MWGCAGVVVAVLCFVAVEGASVAAQTETARLSGRVTDETGAILPDATVEAINIETNTRMTTTTNEQGLYLLPNLRPGRYRVVVTRQGFQSVVVPELVLATQANVGQNFSLSVGSVVQSVTVTGAPEVVSTSPSVSTLIPRQFVENLPLNGRSFHALIELTPGVVLTGSDSQSQGQFSVNGQRRNANYFTVDGVSANVGITPVFGGSQSYAGSIPATSSLGGTSNLVSVDALEEFRIQTSTYAPEFGRSPGGQVSLTTRSGTNDFHGSLFDYWRNDALDANDWFANRSGLPKPELRQHDFGGVLGGPIMRDRTFFFASYEGLRLRQPRTRTEEVPSLAARAAAPAAIAPFLNAFPLPNGRDFGDGTAEFSATYSDPSTLNATSVRIDQVIGGARLFGRLNHAPSGFDERAWVRSSNMIAETRVDTTTVTGGADLLVGSNLALETRVNWSRATGGSRFVLDDFGGGTPPGDDLLFPPGDPSDSSFIFFISQGPISFNRGRNLENRQVQFNVVQSATWFKGTHQMKLGADYRLMQPSGGANRHSTFIRFASIETALALRPNLVSRTEADIIPEYRFHNFSLFAQDTWQASPRTSLAYGVRWEINPAPQDITGHPLLTVRNFDDPSRWELAEPGTELWDTTWGNFAPRVGVSHVLSEDFNTVLRGGFGVFYDLGTGHIGGVASYPYRRFRGVTNTSFPVPAEDLVVPGPVLEPPFGSFTLSDTSLELPYTLQWNVAVEQQVGPAQALTVTYVGADGRRLLRQEIARGLNPDFPDVSLVTNRGTSSYQSLQVQYQRRMTKGFQGLASYTLAEATDQGSADELDLVIAEGPADFDIRQTFTAALSYDIPAPRWGGMANAVLRNWGIDGMFRFRSGLPFHVTAGLTVINEQLVFRRADLVPNVDPWIDDSTAPGGKRLNPTAFAIPPSGQQGDMARNSLRGFGARQIDLSLRRSFSLPGGMRLQGRADFFNVFNTPNFGQPVNNLNSRLFGVSTQMLARGLGQGGFSGGFSPLYQMGGPRSIQLSAKLLF